MTRLSDIATVIRSKNAGPRVLTLDLIFPDVDSFEFVRSAGERLRDEVARVYGLPAGQITIIHYAPANAIKITLPRAVMAGDPDDSDIYGAQQHAPLFEVAL